MITLLSSDSFYYYYIIVMRLPECISDHCVMQKNYNSLDVEWGGEGVEVRIKLLLSHIASEYFLSILLVRY